MEEPVQGNEHQKGKPHCWITKEESELPGSRRQRQEQNEAECGEKAQRQRQKDDDTDALRLAQGTPRWLRVKSWVVQRWAEMETHWSSHLLISGTSQPLACGDAFDESQEARVILPSTISFPAP